MLTKRTIITALFMAILCAAIAASCSPHQQYRRMDNDSVIQGEGHTLAVIEFDDQGNRWSDSQFFGAVSAISSANRNQFGGIVVVFVHGWKHNASVENGHSGNLASFQATLKRIALEERARDAVNPRPVVGVYLAWRGASLLLPDPFLSATYFDRLSTAMRVGSNPDMTETIVAVLTTARENPKTRKLVFGHSMGALILERALSQYLTGLTVSRLLTGHGVPGLIGTTVIDYPADLIVLLNSAAPATYAKSLIDTLTRSQVHSSQPANLRYFDSLPVEWRPLIVSVTSSADTATGRAFPLAMNLAALFQRFRTDLKDSDGADPQIGGREQAPTARYLYTHTPGHVEALFSHTLVFEPGDKGTSGTASGAVEPCPESPRAAGVAVDVEPGGSAVGPYIDENLSVCWRVGAAQYALTRRPPTAWTGNTSPYWVVQVDGEIVANHNAIFENKVLDGILRGLLAFTNVLSGDTDDYRDLSWCVWHEGARAFDDGYPGRLRPINLLRQECLRYQAHSSGALTRLQRATDDDFAGMIGMLAYRLETDFSVMEHLRYALTMRPEIVCAARAAQFGRVRELYQDAQWHNPNARHLLSALSNRQVDGFLGYVWPAQERIDAQCAR
jgi:hypothetical protein